MNAKGGQPYYDPAFAGFGNPYDIPGAAAAGAPLPQDHPPGLADGTNSRGGRGSSEEKELTPGQRRRKEQNRAAYVPCPPRLAPSPR